VIRWRSATVVSVGGAAGGVVSMVAALDDGEVDAIAYADVVGTPQPGDRVLLNVTALELGLGTGGVAMVVAIPDRLPADGVEGGHIVKARYTPLQVTVLAADEQGSPHHDVLRDADDIGGMPVVIADLHSAVPAILAGLRSRRPDARVVRR
jgi:hypothetical protein